MSKDYTPAYVVRMNAGGPNQVHTPSAWNCRQSGRPTKENLEKWVRGFEESTKPGGCNAHLGETVVWSAEIARNRPNGKVVASYKQSAMFVVL